MKQKRAARRNLQKARAVQRARRHGASAPRRSPGMRTAEENRLPEERFAFPGQRKEPLTDASHIRNAVARFDQVEGVSDDDRDRAWRRIKAAARRCGVDVSARDWRELPRGGRAKKR